MRDSWEQADEDASDCYNDPRDGVVSCPEPAADEASGVDLTTECLPVDADETEGFGVMISETLSYQDYEFLEASFPEPEETDEVDTGSTASSGK